MHKTKELLIKNALELFLKNGFTDTSIQEIIDKSKVSKGAFYHYFSSKEEILDTIAEIHVSGIVSIMVEIVDRDDIDALEKFNQIILRISTFKTSNLKRQLAINTAINEESNLMLNKRIIDRSMKCSKEHLGKLFKQGMEEGVFKTEYGEEFAEFLIPLNMTFQKTFFDLDFARTMKTKKGRESLKRSFLFFEHILESVLGLEKGSLVYSKVIAKDLKL